MSKRENIAFSGRIRVNELTYGVLIFNRIAALSLLLGHDVGSSRIF